MDTQNLASEIVLKGILDVEDAKIAAATGVSRFSSPIRRRQLDGAPSSIAALPAIADAVRRRRGVALRRRYPHGRRRLARATH